MDMELFSGLDAPTGQPETLSKKGFAEHLGLSAGRITQLIALGMPEEPSGRINVVKAERWYRANVDANRQRATPAGDRRPFASPRAEFDAIRAERARLALDRERGELVDRHAVGRAMFDRARGERDAWIGWTSRASAELAGSLGVDPGAAFAILDRLVRDQLAALAARPLEDFANG